MSESEYDAGASMTTVFDGQRAKARQLKKAQLVVVEGPDKGETWEIDRQLTVIGRASICEVVLSDRTISNQHFAIEATDDGYRLRDLGSRNGLYVGKVRVMDALLHRGMQFKLGRTTLRFEPIDETIDIQLSDADSFGSAIGMSVAMREIFAHLERLAPSDITVLITGDTGTGKEEIAKGVHDNSNRAAKPFVVVDCGTIPPELIESTLFGHEKGAFTGATDRHIGLFEHADGGTIFLDEIGELHINMQPKLLRVLESRSIARVGSEQRIPVDIRVVAATNRDLRREVAEGRFREDLYFRLSGAQVHLPPLRQRREDIGLLASEFLQRVAKEKDKQLSLGQDALTALAEYTWPGNVRELRNVIERAGLLAEGNVVARADLAFGDGRLTHGEAYSLMNTGQAAASANVIDIDEPFKDAKQKVIDAFEMAYLSQLIEINNNNISRSAQKAGITRYHLRELLKRHGLHQSTKS